MQVEEDPSSQFVDFTNATASEQFISDVEQALIAWQLSHKGHASLDALAAAFPNASCVPDKGSTGDPTAWSHARGGRDGRSAGDPAIWTRSLEFRPSDASAAKHYALTLFVSHQGQQPKQEIASPSGIDAAASITSSRSRMLKKWQEGLEHFTPTMLSVADAGRDFQRSVIADDVPASSASASEAEASTAGFPEEEEGARVSSSGRASAYYTSVFEDDQEAVFSRKTAFQNVQRWFGVDEFLLLTRSSPEVKTTQQEEVALSSRSSRQAKRGIEKLPSDAGDAGENGETEDQEIDDAEVAAQKDVPEVQTEGKGTGGDNTEASTSVAGDDDGMADIPVDQNESSMLLSALTIALNNCNCTIPAFVPVMEPSRGTWVGSAVPGATGNVSISFDTDSVPELNPNQNCISGLLDFFKLKLQLSPQVEEKCRLEAGESGDLAIGMMVSASFGYAWERSEDPRQESTPENPLEWQQLESQLPVNEREQVQQITKKLFGEQHTSPLLGCTTSPLLGMDLTASWPKLREGTYVDNVVHSTLDPNTAPEWMLKVRFEELLAENQRKPQLPLSKRIANLVQVYSNSRELNKDILVSELAPPINYPPSTSNSASTTKTTTTSSPAVSGIGGEATVTTSSATISDSIPAARGAAVVLGHAIGSITSSLVSAATWKGTDVEEIRRIVVELFDEGEVEGEDEEAGRGSKSGGSEPPATMPSSVMHGAPIGELVSILATRMSQLHGINSMSLLWVEFVKALRDRWFQQRLLPFMRTTGEEGGASHNTSSRSLDALFLLDAEAVQLPPPDFRQCLLHQKLQLLNCCIFRQAEVSKPGSTSGSNSVENGGSGEGGGDGGLSDDEFFDSIEQQEGATPPSPPHRPERQPEGVLREVPGVVCLQTNEPLQDPVTQTAVPMTEDVAKQQQDLLTRLGVSVESVMLRQQIQSKALVSDMQAFKAANPRGCLADFIRWYSPKDWIPFESEQPNAQPSDLPAEGRGVWWFERHGMLSERMRFGPGRQHLWQQMWETSAPVPASRQKPLFDPLQESEKVYHYLETLSPHELFHQMLAGAISSNIFALETALPVPVTPTTLPVVYRALQGLRTRGSRAIALLDEALAESQVAFPAAGRSRRRREDDQKQQSLAAAHQGQQLQVAFEMALDACWKLVRALEGVEALVSKTLALLQYFPAPQCDRGALELVNLLLLPTLSRRQQCDLAAALKRDDLRQRVSALVLTNPTLAGAGPMSVPVQREYVLRCICPRPFLREYYGASTLGEHGEGEREDSAMRPEEATEESPLVVNRMYAAFKKSTVRFALTLAESEF